MSRSLSRWQAAVLGVAVLAGGALGAAGLFAVGSQQWPLGDTFVVHAAFANIRGVEEGTRVRIQGMDAGEVTRVQLPDEAGKDVVLRLRLDGRFRHLLSADATAQIVSDNLMGGKVIEIEPGKAKERLPDNAVLAARSAPELTDLLGEGTSMLKEARQGDGTVGKLLKDDAAYRELVELLHQSRSAMASVKQDADAIKALPIVRSYVTDARKELYRPDCLRHRHWFRADELFSADRAVLTAQGRQRLDGIVPWLNALKPKGSEVVVAAYAASGLDADSSRVLTQKQSAAVCDYLTRQHKVQKMGWFRWSRKVTPVGCGNDPALAYDKDRLPVPRVEVLVFEPQK
jgi:phospholipid/cholesterol/gamma-HCH transport system substrate-binding protein